MKLDDLKIRGAINLSFEEYRDIIAEQERNLFLYGTIQSVDDLEEYFEKSPTARIAEIIDLCNTQDRDIPVENRKPIILRINSPGGDVVEGFSLIDTIENSITPVYTINVGQWSSMSFLIGISGTKRFSYKSSIFLLHDGSSFAGGSTNKVQDRVKFEERFEENVIKPHVLKHGLMTDKEYEDYKRVELYMLANEAKERGFIDEIITSIDTILKVR